MSIRVLLVEDQEVVRSGLRALLAGTEFEIVAEAETEAAALEAVERYRPDLALIDVQLPDGDGLAILQQARQRLPSLIVVMLSAHDNPAYEARSHHGGAAGYLLKSVPCEELIPALRDAAQGKRLWTRASLRRLNGISAQAVPNRTGETPLTPREGQVLRMLSAGATNKQIAESLDISTETVKEHVQHLLRKLGLTDRTQAAVWAVRNGLC